MRLIDEDMVIALIDKEYPYVDRQDMKVLIAKTPTAYDVDKVLEELDKYGDRFSDENQNDWWSATVVSNCIDMVKRGGIE